MKAIHKQATGSWFCLRLSNHKNKKRKKQNKEKLKRNITRKLSTERYKITLLVCTTKGGFPEKEKNKKQIFLEKSK